MRIASIKTSAKNSTTIIWNAHKSNGILQIIIYDMLQYRTNHVSKIAMILAKMLTTALENI